MMSTNYGSDLCLFIAALFRIGFGTFDFLDYAVQGTWTSSFAVETPSSSPLANSKLTRNFNPVLYLFYLYYTHPQGKDTIKIYSTPFTQFAGRADCHST